MIKREFRISDKAPESFAFRISFIHNGKEDLSSAFERREKAKINLLVPRATGVIGAALTLYDEKCENKLLSVEGSWSDLKFGNDVYTFPIPIKNFVRDLYYFTIEIFSIFGIIYLDKNCGFSLSEDIENQRHQLLISDFNFPEPKSYYGGVIYHIFVDRFYRAEKTGFEKQIEWGSSIPKYAEYPGAPIKNDYFYGGTLNGILEKLEYIKSLGVNLIYLSPIFLSPSNHKYDTSDYMTVDSGFGGEGALRSLIEKAEKIGIYIILDGVFNHTGDDSVYFNKYNRFNSVGAYQSPDSPFFSWYDFQCYPDEYTSWWGIKILPRINPDLPECREYFLGDGGVIDKYSRMGIAGFRLDVADELSDSFISGIKERLCSNNQSSILYGEVWEDGSNKIAYGKRKRYYLGNELDGVMNYPIRQGLISFLRYGKTEQLRYALVDIIFNAPKRVRDMQMNLLGSHDTVRILTALGAEEPDGKDNEYLSSKIMSDDEYKKARLLLLSAYTVLATLPGIPSVYYGDEAGVEGYSDPFCRKTFPWGKEDFEILAHYRKIGRIRKENSVYKKGQYKLLYLSEELLAFSRYNYGCAYITLVNNSEAIRIFKFKQKAKELLSGCEDFEFSVNPKSSVIFKTGKDNSLKLIN